MTEATNAAGKRILIVDDDQDIRALLTEVLSMEGYDVESAGNGRAGLERLRRGPRPSLMLLDLMMPDMSGWEVLESLKTDPPKQPMIVIVLSAVSDTATPIPNVRWLRKPIMPDDLLTAVRAALQAAPR